MTDPTPADFYRARAQALEDDAVRGLGRRLDRHDAKLDRLEARVNYLFGALAILTILAPLLGDLVRFLLEGN